MKSLNKKVFAVWMVTMALGVLLHFLYEWLPNPLTALLSPVRESLWEHVKLIFWPLLLAGAALTGKSGGTASAPWLLSALISSLVMLGAAYVYHILLLKESMAFDIGLYAAVITAGFFLPGLLWRLTAKPVWRAAAALTVCVMAALVAWFTFFPPEHVLFADLSEAARTFMTIPV